MLLIYSMWNFFWSNASILITYWMTLPFYITIPTVGPALPLLAMRLCVCFCVQRGFQCAHERRKDHEQSEVSTEYIFQQMYAVDFMHRCQNFSFCALHWQYDTDQILRYWYYINFLQLTKSEHNSIGLFNPSKQCNDNNIKIIDCRRGFCR